MAEKKPFLLRVDRELLDAVQRWANDDLRSLNGHIEFLLRDALKRAGRAPKPALAPDRGTSRKPSTEK
ncbi:MAG TPA: Arc family DNA-binding protein [Gemmatimonadaceae bacterium]|nr:Arc family DNA-binding protein [Gemmatimonadaceae bacterium]